MKIIFDEEDTAIVAKVAENYGVEVEGLLETYRGVMLSNFYEDLCDIAREND